MGIGANRGVIGMRSHALFQKDCADRLQQGLASGRVSRRDFLQMSAMLGLSTAAVGLGAGRAAAAEGITVVNYGGDAVDAYAQAWTGPFTAESGIPVAIDGTGPLVGRIRKMVDDRAVTWDVCDGAPYYALQMGPDYCEPIDYSVVDETKFFDWNKNALSAGNYVFSTVLAYDSSKFETAPTGWKDFFDLEKFPGKRVMFKWFDGQPEACLLAAGIAPADLYPLDMGLVAEMIASLGDNLVLWDSGADSQQVFLSGEVVMGNIWNTRASQLERDTGGRVKWIWNEQIVQPAAWIIPKGSAKAAEAQKFIASTQDVTRQIKMLDLMGNGPANPAALTQLSEEQIRLNPTSHMETAIPINSDWYAANYNEALDAWMDAIGA